eukprot:TRINITY_DN1841_c0_g1_i1.p1 TRINITY_DN1841_c0_g1~~TRINITY_DN1841_c0_g1_i1.p1  ORF type:complete len:401 (-),score=72.25 TRINITY_DN1841_c0_g1_i1:1263-2378(-)
MSQAKIRVSPFQDLLDFFRPDVVTPARPHYTYRWYNRECAESLFTVVPDEVLLHLLSFLSADDVLSASLVCRHIERISSDDLIWKRLYSQDKWQWSLFSKLSSTHTVDHQPPSWKRRYLSQATINNLPSTPSLPAPRTPEPERSTQNPILDAGMQAISMGVSLFNDRFLPTIQPLAASFRNNRFFVPMFGEGMDSIAAKDLLYSMMWQNNTKEFKIAGLYPGVEGVGSGVAFQMEGGPELNVSAIHKYARREMFHADKLRPVWKKCLQAASGIVFVVYQGDHLQQAQAGLEMFTNVGGISPTAPMLVLLCHDTASLASSSSTPYNVADVARELNLEGEVGRHRPWRVQKACLDDLDGVWSGFKWLATTLSQ